MVDDYAQQGRNAKKISSIKEVSWFCQIKHCPTSINTVNQNLRSKSFWQNSKNQCNEKK